MPGVGEIVVIAAALMLLFGAKRIPVIARGLGESFRNFKGEMKGGSEAEPPALDEGEDRPRRDASSQDPGRTRAED